MTGRGLGDIIPADVSSYSPALLVMGLHVGLGSLQWHHTASPYCGPVLSSVFIDN